MKYNSDMNFRRNLISIPFIVGWRELCYDKTSLLVFLTKYYQCDQIKEDGMIRTCSMNGRDEKYEGRLKSLWTHLITPSRNFVELWWRSLFRSTSYNAPPTSRKHAADRWSLRNFSPRSFIFMSEKVQKSQGVRSELNSVFSLEEVDWWNPIRTSAIQSRSLPKQFLGFLTMKRELRGKKFRSDQRSAARFGEVGGAL
jgi:hypothetical protein